jgi:cytochrome c biogenesis protein CcdA
MALPQENASPESNASGQQTLSPEERRKRILIIVAAVFGLLAILTVMGFAIAGMLNAPEFTTTLRDVMIILVGIELALIGFSAIILIYQIARLINMVRNEIRPVLDSANATMNTLRGTAAFLGDNLVRPVVKINTYLAGARRLLNMFNPGPS